MATNLADVTLSDFDFTDTDDDYLFIFSDFLEVITRFYSYLGINHKNLNIAEDYVFVIQNAITFFLKPCINTVGTFRARTFQN